VVAVDFQRTFCIEMHQNNIFLFLKNYFLDQHIKTIQNILKKINFFGNAVCTAFPNVTIGSTLNLGWSLVFAFQNFLFENILK
jgi:ketopantoate reductase